MNGNSIGGRIAEKRKELGLTQSELALNLSVKRETINQWENGIRQIKGEDIARLADALETTTDYILRGIKPENLDIARETGLSDKAIEVLRKIAPGKEGRVVGVQAKGYALSFSDCISDLIESKYFFDLFNGIGFFLIYGGILPEDAYNADEVKLSVEEYKKFMSWAASTGQEVIPRNETAELYLQKSCNALRDICKEMLENGKHSREKE